jgi:hypothetical protein
VCGCVCVVSGKRGNGEGVGFVCVSGGRERDGKPNQGHAPNPKAGRTLEVEGVLVVRVVDGQPALRREEVGGVERGGPVLCIPVHAAAAAATTAAATTALLSFVLPLILLPTAARSPHPASLITATHTAPAAPPPPRRRGGRRPPPYRVHVPILPCLLIAFTASLPFPQQLHRQHTAPASCNPTRRHKERAALGARGTPAAAALVVEGGGGGGRRGLGMGRGQEATAAAAFAPQALGGAAGGEGGPAQLSM